MVEPPTVGSLLAQAIALTKDPAMKQALQQQAQQAEAAAQAPSTAAAPPPAEAVRRAEGAWKDASLRFEQAAG